jgi:hypothetical protein
LTHIAAAKENIMQTAPSQKRNYEFIDHIRCISMISVVFEHGFNSDAIPMRGTELWAYSGIVQLAKFGTVAFFLLAGFLIGEKFSEYTPGVYLKRRFSNTFGPWLFWSLLHAAGLIFLYATHRFGYTKPFTLAGVLDIVKWIYLFSNYWFIINFMLSITLLLVFKRYLYSWAFGGILLLFTLGYAINIHYEWFVPQHTSAMLGFIFFLWLGAQMRKYWPKVEHWLGGVNYFTLITVVIATYLAALYEMDRLMQMHSIDPYNSLRITNLLFSMAVFALMLKIKNFPFVNFLQPRQTTYGVYLIHFVVTTFALGIVTAFFHYGQKVEVSLSTGAFIAGRMAEFLFVYLITITAVMLINKTRLKVLVGN